MINIKYDLAAAYQIFAYLGLDDHTYTHLSARYLNHNCYCIYPFGIRFEEVTSDNLIVVDLNGRVIEGEEAQYNQTGYVIHGSIYSKREDINAVFHLHTPASVAVASMKCGLLPISQWSLHFYNQVSYHAYNALALDFVDHGEKIANDLGGKNVMFLCNHGFITCGRTLHEAMFYAYHLEMSCRTQIMALSSNQELIKLSDQVCEKSNKDLLSFEKDLGKRDWDAWVRVLKHKIK